MFLGGTLAMPSPCCTPLGPGCSGRVDSGWMVSPWRRKQGEASLQPARLPSNTNTDSAGESRVPSLSPGTECFILGFFISVQCWSYTDAACSPPMARKLCTWASSQDAEDLCFSRSFINLATYGSILRASPPPPPPPPPPPSPPALPSPPQNAGAGPGLSLAPYALHAGFVHPWGNKPFRMGGMVTKRHDVFQFLSLSQISLKMPVVNI